MLLHRHVVLLLLLDGRDSRVCMHAATMVCRLALRAAIALRRLVWTLFAPAKFLWRWC